MPCPNTRQGWRRFKCWACEWHWEEPTRDYHSSSGELCPKCGQENKPLWSSPDETLKVDKWGNLI